MPRFILALLCFLIMLAAPIFAQDLQNGEKAFAKKDYATALKEWRPLAERGILEAQYRLALMYVNGLGVSRDYKEAVKWFKLAAEQDSPKAINHMAVLYDNGGFGLTADHKKAVFYYRQAAEQGDADAQYNLGQNYIKGEGVSQDFKEALSWYQLAAEQGNASAMNDLGAMYGRGPEFLTIIRWLTCGIIFLPKAG